MDMMVSKFRGAIYGFNIKLEWSYDMYALVQCKNKPKSRFLLHLKSMVLIKLKEQKNECTWWQMQIEV